MTEKVFKFFEDLSLAQACIIILFVGITIYANTFFNQLFWDDYDSIVNNVYIRDWKNLPKFFTENLTAGAGIRDNYWRPLLLVSFSLDYHLGKLSPFFYHLQNILWHILSACLFYLITFKFFRNRIASLAASLIFLVHPLQVEAVAYVAGRADPMHAAFMLFSFLFFYKYVSEKLPGKWHVWSLIFFAAALMVKERAIIFPMLPALYFLTLHKEPISQNWKSKIIILLPYFAVAVIYLILRMTVLHFASTFDLGQPNNIGADNLSEYLMAYLYGIAAYAGLLVWPAKLYMEKSLSLPQSFFDFQLLAGVFLFFLSVAGIIISLKRRKIFAFGMLWFWIALSPSLHVYPIQGLLYEHWLYFPFMGLAIAFIVPAVLKINKINSKTLGIVASCALAVIVLALSGRTIVRNSDWNNPIKFYEKNIALGGASARVYTNLGMAYSEAGRYEEAATAYLKATELDGQIFQPWYNLGNDHRELKEYEKAAQAYLRAIELNPYFLSSYYNLAVLHVEDGKPDEAIKILREAEKIKPEEMATLYNIGMLYARMGEKEKAREYLEKTLKLDPGNFDLIMLINSL